MPCLLCTDDWIRSLVFDSYSGALLISCADFNLSDSATDPVQTP